MSGNRQRPARRIISAAAACLLAALLCTPAAVAAPPPNDAFAAAEPLAGVPVSVDGTNAEATVEPGEPYADEFVGASVWYTWTAPAPGAYQLDTCSSDFDTVLGVYTGDTVAGLSTVAFSDDSCDRGSRVWVRAAGAVYRIAVAGFEGAQGNYRLAINQVNAPANDHFASAHPVSGPRWEVEGIAVMATSEPGEPAHGGAPALHTVWMRWVAPVSDRYLLSSGGNVRLGLYTGGGLGALSAVAATYDPVEGFMWFSAVAGTEYRIAVSWHESDPDDIGQFFLSANRAGLTASPNRLQFAPQAVNTISAPSVVSLVTAPDALVTLPFDITVRGPHAADFLKAGDDCSDEFAERCSVSLRFAPSAVGLRTATLAVETWIGTYVMPISGAGTQAVGDVPSSPPPPPAPAAPAFVPSIRGQAACTLRSNTRRGAVVRCVVTRGPAAHGTVTGTLRRGGTTRGRGSARLRAGKATMLLKSRRKLSRGRYRVSLSIAVRGARPLTLTRTVRVR
jgi:hypothetical protein